MATTFVRIASPLVVSAALLSACASQKEAPAPAPQASAAPAAHAPSAPTPTPPAATTAHATHATPAHSPTASAHPGASSPHASHAAGGAPVSRTGLKIRFGIMPGNYDDDQDGVLVDDVYEDTSAADAGIKRGDRLMTWNSQPITDIGNWMEHMSAHNPGDIVEVGVLRGGKTIPVKVTLKGPSL